MLKTAQSKATSFRFVDMDSKQSPHKNFVRRRRSPDITEQFLMCLVVILTSVSMILMIHNTAELITVLLIMTGLSAVYVTTQTKRNREVLYATEFQNALFSAALTKDYLFCLITSTQGAIVYFNREFTARFPSLRAGDNVKEWLTQGNASAEDSQRVIESTAINSEQKFPISLKDCDEKTLTLQLNVEPIMGRLPGFMLLRASQAG